MSAMTTAASLEALLEALLARAVRSALDEYVIQQRPPPKPRPALLDRASLATELAVSVAHIDHLRRAPKFPTIYVGEAPRFELAAVLAWLKERRRA
jgi:hypothetical protein